LPKPIAYESHREFVRETLRNEAHLTASGPSFVPFAQETSQSPSAVYRDQLNSEGSPSQTVATGYVWAPGTELSQKGPAIGNGAAQSARP
jgi:hypothetical protein